MASGEIAGLKCPSCHTSKDESVSEGNLIDLNDNRSEEDMDCSEVNGESYVQSFSESNTEPPITVKTYENEQASSSQLETVSYQGSGNGNYIPIPTIEQCQIKLKNLRPDNTPGAQVFTLIKVPYTKQHNKTPMPYPNNFIDKWDVHHVKMPNSQKNEMTKYNIGIKYTTPRWIKIDKYLSKQITSYEELSKAIKKYNPNLEHDNFDVLKKYMSKYNIIQTLAKMAQLVLKTPKIVTVSVPLLKQRQNSTLILSQYQIACLIANEFFCTFPRRNKLNAEYNNFPIPNLSSLMSSNGQQNEIEIKMEKLKCLFNYFTRVFNDRPNGLVSFQRRYMEKYNSPKWHNSYKSLTNLHVFTDGSIENEGKGLTMIDFANKFIGGGILGSGCVQEEILFLIFPELFVSRLFTENLLENEAIIINGCEQFNKYSGYSNSFKFTGDFNNQVNSDEWGRKYTQIIAIDALHFNHQDKYSQFDEALIKRELNKAYCGFLDFNTYRAQNKPAIASGKWGCGCFNGDPYLKCLLQWMAASEAGRDLVLYTNKDTELRNKLVQFCGFAKQKDLKVRNLYKSIVSYRSQQRSRNAFTIIDFVYNQLK